MRSTSVRLLSSSCLAVSLWACGPDMGGFEPVDGGTDAGSEPAIDGGPTTPQLMYTPEGCGYEVETPTVRHTGMHEATFGASAQAPDHLHVSWAGPSHTSFAVNWRTDGETRSSLVIYGTDRAAVEAADGPGAGVTQQAGHFLEYADGVVARRTTTVHEVHVCGLSPSTTYYYRVGGPGHWSEVQQTSTAPMPGTSEAFRFGVTGDSRGYVDSATGANVWAIAQRRLAESMIDFEVFTGDAVVIGTEQAGWNGFFEATDGDFAVTELFASTPLMMTNGNHEDLAVAYLAQFAWPQDVSDEEIAEGEEWYSFDYGNAHFVVLNDTVVDDEVIAGAQRSWLEADLTAVDRETTPWIFAVHHRPFYTCGSTHGADGGLRAAWQPVYDRFAVDIVFNGHNHVYERTHPIRGLDAAGDGIVVPADGATGIPTIVDGTPNGTLYVLTAGAGAPLYPVSSDCPTSFVAESVRNYAVVEIEGRSLTLTAYETGTDRVIDTFTYVK